MYDILLVRSRRSQSLIQDFLSIPITYRIGISLAVVRGISKELISITLAERSGVQRTLDKEEISIRVLVRCFSTRKLSQRRRGLY